LIGKIGHIVRGLARRAQGRALRWFAAAP
jgi:hypothetical protein